MPCDKSSSETHKPCVDYSLAILCNYIFCALTACSILTRIDCGILLSWLPRKHLNKRWRLDLRLRPGVSLADRLSRINQLFHCG